MHDSIGSSYLQTLLTQAHTEPAGHTLFTCHRTTDTAHTKASSYIITLLNFYLAASSELYIAPFGYTLVGIRTVLIRENMVSISR